MKEKIINVGEDFSKFPGGRYESDGPFSGEAFRGQFLEIIRSNDRVVFDLDTTEGYSSAFLEAAFHGLAREDGLTLKSMHEKIGFITEHESLVDEIWEYIEKVKCLK